MLVREIITDAKTGEVTERMVEMPGVITEAEAIERDRLAMIEAYNAEIRAQLDANDLKAVRALLDGDMTRIAQHKQAQAALRAQLK